MFTRTTLGAGMIAVVTTLIYASAWGDVPVPYPADYRKWSVLKTFVIGTQHKKFESLGGMHHYYANDKARESFGQGKFAEGSIIVDERVQAAEHEGAIFEGKRISAAVMIKDSARYRDTGGWAFDLFTEGATPRGASAEVRAACFECHSKRKDQDYVFTELKN